MHATATVILGADIDPLDRRAVDARIAQLMAPFDENTEVPHRERMSRRDLSEFITFYTDAKHQEQVLNREARTIPVGSPLSAFLTFVQDWNSGYAARVVDDFDAEGSFETIEATHNGNPAGMWDWYEIGGRWLGYFALKPGIEGILGEPGTGGNRPTAQADVARVKDIDLMATAISFAAEAGVAWDTAQADKHQDAGWRSMAYGILPDDTRDAYIARSVGRSVATHTIINGEWIARETWNHDRREFDVVDADQWSTNYYRLLFEDLDPETVIAIVDYHH